MDAVIAAPPEHTIEQVLDTFATSGGTLPREAMQWALDNWKLAAPRVLAVLDAWPNGKDQAAADILFFALHLCAEKRETRAFQPLCRLLRDPLVEDVLGDAITTTLTGILISTFDGDVEPLKSVIEDPAADEFIRSAALDALSYLAHAGLMPMVNMKSYLQYLFVTMRPHSAGIIWAHWAMVVARLGYADMTQQVARAFHLGRIERSFMGMHHFKADLRRALDDPTAGFSHDGIAPFTDAIGVLSTWYGFSEQRREDERRRAEQALFAEPARRRPPVPSPLRTVGRNDPCPCGSGKKFKKCCLQ
jgi:uncharacterized protein